MVKRFVFLLMTGFIFFQGCAMASELIDDIKQAREKDNSTRLDVSSIVRKHVKNESSWDAISDRLVKDGFECHARPPQKSDSNLTVYDCVLDLRKWYKLGFGDKLRLDISVQNDSVITSGGELIYLSL
jgi:hypothetical protein